MFCAQTCAVYPDARAFWRAPRDVPKYSGTDREILQATYSRLLNSKSDILKHSLNSLSLKSSSQPARAAGRPGPPGKPGGNLSGPGGVLPVRLERCRTSELSKSDSNCRYSILLTQQKLLYIRSLLCHDQPGSHRHVGKRAAGFSMPTVHRLSFSEVTAEVQ
eukprot:765028-Hanusia_phi.AAC.2